MIVARALVLMFLYFSVSDGTSCSECRPGMEGRCCSAQGEDFCDVLIPESHLEAWEDTLVIPCDAGTTCIVGPIKWTTPRGDVCQFERGGSSVCLQDKSIAFTGNFETGRCDILVTDFNEDQHEGRWSVSIRLARNYRDNVEVEMTGLHSSEILGISSAVIIIILIIIVAIIVWRCFPNLCKQKPQNPPNSYHPPGGGDMYETLHASRRVSTPQEIYVHSQEAIVNPPPTKTAKLIPRQL